MRMDKEVFSNKLFAAYAREHLVLLEADFPRRKPINPQLKAKNTALSKQFGVRAFPTLVILDSQGKKLDEIVGYDGKGPKAFIDGLKKHRKK